MLTFNLLNKPITTAAVLIGMCPVASSQCGLEAEGELSEVAVLDVMHVPPPVHFPASVPANTGFVKKLCYYLIIF